jgi:hypothetical protein
MTAARRERLPQYCESRSRMGNSRCALSLCSSCAESCTWYGVNLQGIALDTTISTRKINSCLDKHAELYHDAPNSLGSSQTRGLFSDLPPLEVSLNSKVREGCRSALGLIASCAASALGWNQKPA